MVRRVSVLLTLAALLVALIFVARPAPASCKGCNVILISIDTLGARHTSVNDTTLDTTPKLAARASTSGVVFERAYSQAPWTLASHTAMLTGLYPWDAGVEGPNDALPKRISTIAERFAEEGYRTAAFSTGSFVQPNWQFDQGFSEFHGSLSESTWNDLPSLFEDARAWAASSSEPFFLFVHSFHVHDPYGNPAEGGIDIHDIVKANRALEGPDERDAARFRDAYRAEVRQADAALGDFLDALETSGLLGRTIVLITSDHGEEFGEHGTAGYHSVAVYDESIHVPLVLFAPHQKPARIPYTVEVRSVPATLLESVGIAPTAGIAKSLMPFVRGSEAGDRLALSRTIMQRSALLEKIEQSYDDLALYESGVNRPEERTEPLGAPYASVALLGSRAVMRHGDGSLAAFDLASDPDEKNNLATGETVPDAFVTLLKTLENLGE